MERNSPQKSPCNSISKYLELTNEPELNIKNEKYLKILLCLFFLTNSQFYSIFLLITVLIFGYFEIDWATKTIQLL